MMKKLAKVGYRVAPMYLDEPNGTIVEIINDSLVKVNWDSSYLNLIKSGIQIEQIKFLRKGK